MKPFAPSSKREPKSSPRPVRSHLPRCRGVGLLAVGHQLPLGRRVGAFQGPYRQVRSSDAHTGPPHRRHRPQARQRRRPPHRPDVRADVEAGEIGGFTVNQAFLLGTTAYIVIPSLMVFLSLILRPRVNRIANIALSVMYALTIIAASIGEWNYYIFGSAIEVMLLAAIVSYSWTWPTEAPPNLNDLTDDRTQGGENGRRAEEGRTDVQHHI